MTFREIPTVAPIRGTLFLLGEKGKRLEKIGVSSDSNGLGRAIAALRGERGWKRKDLVEAAGISYPFLAEVENGNKRPSMTKLNDIAEALGMTSSELMARAHEIEERFGTGGHELRSSQSWNADAMPASYATAGPLGREGMPRETSEVDMITSAVMSALEPRLRELVELEVRRQLDRQRGSAW